MTTANTEGRALSDAVAEEIRAMMARRRMSGRELALALNVSPAWVSYRLVGKQPIDLNDLHAIAGVLKVGVADLFPTDVRRAMLNTSGILQKADRPRDNRPSGRPDRGPSNSQPSGRPGVRRPRRIGNPQSIDQPARAA